MRILNLLFLGLAISAYAAVDQADTVSSQTEQTQTEVQAESSVAPSEEPLKQAQQQQVQQPQQTLPPPQAQQPMMQPQYAPQPQMYPATQYVQPRPIYGPQPVARPMLQPNSASLENSSEKGYIRNGFFFEADLGVRYMRLENKEYDDYYDDQNA